MPSFSHFAWKYSVYVNYVTTSNGNYAHPLGCRKRSMIRTWFDSFSDANTRRCSRSLACSARWRVRQGAVEWIVEIGASLYGGKQSVLPVGRHGCIAWWFAQQWPRAHTRHHKDAQHTQPEPTRHPLAAHGCTGRLGATQCLRTVCKGKEQEQEQEPKASWNGLAFGSCALLATKVARYT